MLILKLNIYYSCRITHRGVTS